MTDNRLAKLRQMDPTIGTFTASELVSDPKYVHETYLEHAETHMSLGDMSNYVSQLVRWVKTNSGTVIGAITGEYGYGKTSSAIHLWQQCEEEHIIAVPPFEWHRLQDIVDATWKWVRYKIENVQPTFISVIDAIYSKYEAKSAQEFADCEGIPLSRVHDLVARGTIRLECNSESVIEFLAEISKAIEQISGFCGPVVFTDELQVTMSEYNKRHLSRDEFMQDIFGLLNPLLNKKGSFGLIIGLPLNTETLINGARPDILQRLQNCSLYIRPNSMYSREFPKSLWDKFAHTFQFEEIADSILPDDTVDSLGQIAFRNDLGAGPRTVIQAMKCAIEYYDASDASYTPIQLINDYLDKKIAFDSGGKLIAALTEVLQSKDVKTISRASDVIKLMAAYPFGCPDTQFQKYELVDTKDEIVKRIYTEYLYKFPEGISIRKLAPTERGAEPRFIELTKEFIQTYSESDRDIEAAVNAFKEILIYEQILSSASRRADQIEGWIRDSQSSDVFIGTFDRRFPERRVSFKVSRERGDLTLGEEEFGIGFYLNPDCDYSASGKIEYGNAQKDQVIFNLNLLCRPKSSPNIPYIEELGYTASRVTPAFMLSLLSYLRSKKDLIPEDEKRIQIPTFERRIIEASIEMLLNSDLLLSSEIENLTKVGKYLPQEILGRLFRDKYPDYETLITTGRWNGSYSQLMAALENSKISSSIGVLRGTKSIQLPQADALALFGETKIQTLKGLAENLTGCLEIELGSRADSTVTIKFKLHQAETAFVNLLRSSDETIRRNHDDLRAVDQRKGFDFLGSLGYRAEEIKVILRMLKTRRIVDFDEKKACFIEVLESPDERREQILSGIADGRSKVGKLSEIPDFESDNYETKYSRLETETAGCNDIEKLEEYQTQLIEITSELQQFIRVWSDKLRGDAEKIRAESEQIANSAMPEDLATSLKSDVNWVGELTGCQIVLREKYQKGISAFKSISKQVTTAQKALGDAPANDATAIVAFYKSINTLKADLKTARMEIESAKAYLQSFLAWSHVLNSASRVYKDALNCQSTYKQDTFKVEADLVFQKILENLNKKRLEALANHEMFNAQLQTLQSKIDSWLRDRRDLFMKDKVNFENHLRDMGIGQFNIRATFDAFDPESSREVLYDEVGEKLTQRISDIEQEFNRYSTELLFAEQVFGSDVSDAKKHLSEVRTQIEKARGMISESCISNPASFEQLHVQVSSLIDNVRLIQDSVVGVLEKRPVNLDEESILNLMQDPRGADLSTIIVQKLGLEGEQFSLDNLLKVIIDLFKKNQIIIRIEKRR